MERLEYKVAAEDEGKSAGYLLRTRLDLSAGLVRRLKTLPDGIMLDGERVFTNALPKKGQVLSALKDGGRQQDILPVKGPLDIVYEDGDLLIANKQAPLPVHPSRGHYDDTLANYLVYEMERRKEPFSFHAVNRLDSGTSGLMCVAKNAHFANRLSELLRNGGITRLYMAVCLGEIKEDKGRVELPISRKEGFGIMRRVSENGEYALTRYRVLARGLGRSLVLLKLETGRTHQIRVHMAALGHSLYGDFMYGHEEAGFPRTALHSCHISIKGAGKDISLYCPPPDIFFELVGQKPFKPEGL